MSQQALKKNEIFVKNTMAELEKGFETAMSIADTKEHNGSVGVKDGGVDGVEKKEEGDLEGQGKVLANGSHAEISEITADIDMNGEGSSSKIDETVPIIKHPRFRTLKKLNKKESDHLRFLRMRRMDHRREAEAIRRMKAKRDGNM